MDAIPAAPAAPNPFSIFSLEIWDLILKDNSDPNTIANIFEVFPQLKSLADGKQFCWRIGSVMPHLMKYLSFEDVKTCRQVSPRWRNAIKSTFDSMPVDPLPVNYKTDPFSKYVAEKPRYRPNDFPVFKTIFGRIISSTDEITIASIGQDPFPQGYLEVSVKEMDHQWICPHAIFLAEFRSAAPTINIIGKFVSHLSFKISCINGNCGDYFTDVVQEFLRSLAHFTNLRSLKVTMDQLWDTPHTVYLKRPIQPIPQISPRLEKVDLTEFSNVDPEIYSSIFNALSSQDSLRNLVLNLDNWEKEYGTIFSNLTHLSLLNTDSYPSSKVVQVLKDLKSLCSLRNLSISSANAINITDLFDAIAQHHIENLQVLSDNLEEDPKRNDVVIISSIKCLKLTFKPELTFNFLKSLPSLQKLYACYAKNEGWDSFRGCVKEKACELRLGLRQSSRAQMFDEDDFKCIWGMCPSLVQLIVRRGENGRIMYRQSKTCTENKVIEVQ